jgi:hypothetical protein
LISALVAAVDCIHGIRCAACRERLGRTAPKMFADILARALEHAAEVYPDAAPGCGREGGLH